MLAAHPPSSSSCRWQPPHPRPRPLPATHLPPPPPPPTASHRLALDLARWPLPALDLRHPPRCLSTFPTSPTFMLTSSSCTATATSAAPHQSEPLSMPSTSLPSLPFTSGAWDKERGTVTGEEMRRAVEELSGGEEAEAWRRRAAELAKRRRTNSRRLIN